MGTAFCLLLLLFCAGNQQRERIVWANSELLKAVKELSAARPFEKDRVSRLTAHQLRPVPDSGNPYFSVLSSKDERGRLFREVELRVPGNGASAKDGLVVLTVQPKLCVERREVLESFGKESEISVPTPRQPPESPVYLVYQYAWGAIRFGFERTGRECLRTVILDATRT